MSVVIFALALVCALLAYVLVEEDKKNTKLVVENSQMKGRLDAMKEAAADVTQEQTAMLEESNMGPKPLTVDAIRTALRFNGFSPEVSDTHEPGFVYFKDDNVNCRVVADHLPFISLDCGFKLEEPKEDLELLLRAAAEVTQNLFIGKAYVVGDGDGVIFSAEFIGNSYVFFRDNLKQFLTILQEADKRFFQTLESLRERRAEDLKAAFSGNCFVQDSPAAHKVQS